jgi:hypothetical protein
MSRFLGGIAALTLAGAAMMPIQAGAAEPQAGISTNKAVTSTDMSAQRYYWRPRYYGYYGPRRYWGPRYGYYGYPRPYYRPYYYGYPYAYRPGPFVGFGFGPFGFRVF